MTGDGRAQQETDLALALDAWCKKQCDLVLERVSPYIMEGGDLDAPWYREALGQSHAFHRMRSFIHGAKRAAGD